jgi:DNA-binding transcriptional regulator YiaG
LNKIYSLLNKKQKDSREMRQNKNDSILKAPCPTREDFLKDIVSQLVQRRQKLGLTQEKVDQIMGNSDRLCSKWECGMRTPTSFNLYCWVVALSSQIKII